MGRESARTTKKKGEREGASRTHEVFILLLDLLTIRLALIITRVVLLDVLSKKIQANKPSENASREIDPQLELERSDSSTHLKGLRIILRPVNLDPKLRRIGALSTSVAGRVGFLALVDVVLFPNWEASENGFKRGWPDLGGDSTVG